MAMHLPCQVDGSELVIKRCTQFNAMQQLVLPGFSKQANALHRLELIFQFVVDFTVQRIHVIEMPKDGAQSNIRPLGDLLRGGGQMAFVNQRGQSADNFLPRDDTAMDASIRLGRLGGL